MSKLIHLAGFLLVSLLLSLQGFSAQVITVDGEGGGIGIMGPKGENVFEGFTHHIAQQITKDKINFAEAESCTMWFYKQLRKSPGVLPT